MSNLGSALRQQIQQEHIRNAIINFAKMGTVSNQDLATAFCISINEVEQILAAEKIENLSPNKNQTIKPEKET